MKRSTELRDSMVTIGAIAVLAYIFADVMHEVVGHGAACWLTGGEIPLLTSAYFRCSSPMRIVDAAGPIANLTAAFFLSLTLKLRKGYEPRVRLFLVLAFAFNFFWCSAQMIYSAVLNSDDWSFALSGLVAMWFWRPGLCILGGTLYIVGIKRLARELRAFSAPNEANARDRTRRILVTSYITAGLMACLAATLYRPDPFGAVREVALETFAVNCGLLILARRLENLVYASFPAPTISLSVRWLATTIIVFCAFSAVLGRGL